MKRAVPLLLALLLLLAGCGAANAVEKAYTADTALENTDYAGLVAALEAAYPEPRAYLIEEVHRYQDTYYIFARPNRYPDNELGQIGPLLLVYEKEGTDPSAASFSNTKTFDCTLAMSGGYAVKKAATGGVTFVFGEVGEQLWDITLTENPIKVHYTSVSLFYDGGKRLDRPLENNGGFLFTIEGNPNIEDVIFYEDGKELSRLTTATYDSESAKKVLGKAETD